MRRIDADALIVELQKDEERFDKEADDCRKNSQNYTDCYMQAMSSRADGIRDAIIEIYDAPTIDAVEVVHGEWIPMEYIEEQIKEYRKFDALKADAEFLAWFIQDYKDNAMADYEDTQTEPQTKREEKR